MMEIRGDLLQINMDLRQYYEQGYRADVQAATRHAHCATRAYVARLHPATGFGGRSLRTAPTSTGGSDNLIKKGSFLVYGYKVDSNIYADYLARWYNIGVYFRPLRYGPHKGEMPSDEQRQSRTPYMLIHSNTQKIKDFFQAALERDLTRRIQEKLSKGGRNN